MALIRPVLATPPAFDATKEYTFTFSVGSGGDQVVGNQLTIIKQETNDIVYRKSITSFAFSHTIPENTLVNGEYYSAYVFTTNSNGENSSASNSVQFYCFSTPSFEFYNMPVDFVIQNSSYLFRVKYDQAEEESLNSYIFNLYDTQRILISTSGTKYIGSLVKPPNIVEHQFGGLVDNSAYYIEAIGRTVNNTEIKTELISFVVKYSTPNIFTVVQLTNNCQGGYITVKSNLTSIEGESNPTPPAFVDDNTAVNLTGDGSYVIWKEGFAIPNDFTASLWGRSFNKDSTIITMRSKLLGDTLTINYREDDANKVYVELIAAKGTACYYIYSDKIDKPAPTDKVQIWLRRISNLYVIGVYNLGSGGA